MKTASSFTFAFVLAFAPIALGQTPQAVVDRISKLSNVRNAEQIIENDHERIVQEMISLNEVPAPPFKEADRARTFAQMLRESGMANVEIDPEGNVLALRKGAG